MKKLYICTVVLSIIGALYIYKGINAKKLITEKFDGDLEYSNLMPVNQISNDPYDPIVYIYNTHQKEAYASDGVSFNPSVLDASYTLRDYLEELNIQTLVESSDFYDFLALNNWDYNSLYKVSSFYLDDTMKRYKNIRLYIDLHRDSIKHDLSTKSIDGKDYAKILFVVGLSHDNYKENLNVAKKINSIISKKLDISRGILQKSIANANGIYNQDKSPNVVLIEVGGYQNKYSEVDNTLKIVAEAIKEYLDE